MPITYSTYRAYDQENGAYVSPPMPDIVDAVPLAGLRLTLNSNIITVTSTEGLFPGMALFLPHVPQGAYIHAIPSLTQIVAYGFSLNATTGEFTVSAAAANATLEVSTGDLGGHARGFNEFGIPTPQSNGGTYSHEHFNTGAGWSGIGDFYNGSTGTAIVAVAGQAGIVVVPDQLTVSPVGTTGAQSTVAVAATTMKPQVADSIAKVPPRTLTRWVHEYVLVSRTGAVSRVRKSPNVQLVRTGASA